MVDALGAAQIGVGADDDSANSMGWVEREHPGVVKRVVRVPLANLDDEELS